MGYIIDVNKKFTKEFHMASIYETVKTVNGHSIYRMVGTHGFYHVDIKHCGEAVARRTFKTIKSAVAFCKEF